MKFLYKIFSILISMFICLSLSINSNKVAASIDENKSCSISIHFDYGDISYFSLYKIADYKDNEYKLTNAFKSYPIQIETNNDDDLRSLAITLSGYIRRDNIKPVKTAVLNNDNSYTWSHINAGLYLVLANQIENDSAICNINPMLIYVPSFVDGTLEYNVNVNVKYEVDEKDLIDIDVMKIWKNDSADNRPKSIEIQLLRDNEVYDTVILNKTNNWKYQWKALSNVYEWNITEKNIYDGYSVLIDREGYSFIVSNSYFDSGKKQPEDKIPQTGQLWWPVPVLVIIGLASYSIGYLLKKEVRS